MIFSKIQLEGSNESRDDSVEQSKENHARTTMSLLEYMNMQQKNQRKKKLKSLKIGQGGPSPFA